MKDPRDNPMDPEATSSIRGIRAGLVFDSETTAKLRSIQESVRIDPKLFEAAREIQESMRVITEPLTKMMTELAESMAISSQRVAELMANMPSQEEQAEGFKIATSILAERGWYISMWHTPLSGIQTFARMYQDGKDEDAERNLIHHFNEISDSIIEEACKVAPSRAVLLRKAYAMHQKEDYDFSIPIFLAQADGIGFDLLGASPYTREPTRRKTIETKLSAALNKDFVSPYWSLVLQTLPINENTSKLDTYRDPLNRHAVLHGLSTNYGTKVNGFRSLSWLQYVVSFSELAWYASLEKENGRQ